MVSLAQRTNLAGSARLLGAVVGRELFEWRWLLAAAPLLGLFAHLAPLLPGLRHHGNQAIEEAALLVFLFLFGIGSAMVLGSSLVARDLAEGRLGFYLARPIPTPTLWLGKLLAGLGLLLLILFGLLLPTLLIDGPTLLAEKIGGGDPGGQPPFSALGEATALQFLDYLLPANPAWLQLLQFGAAILLILLGVHALATVLRDRGPWLAFDFAALLGVLVLLRGAHAEMLGHQLYGPMVMAERALLFGSVVALALALGVQLEWGRTDVGRGRRVLSLVAWGGLLACALLVRVYAHSASHPEIEDLETLDAGLLSPDGRWLLATGPMHGRSGALGTFLLDLETPPGADGLPEGHYLGGLAPSTAAAAFSDDSRRLAWSQCRTLVPTDCELRFAELEDPSPVLSAPPRKPTVAIPIDYFYTHLDLSPDGSRVGLARNHRFDAYELESGRLLGSVPGQYVRWAHFVDRDTARIYRESEDSDPEPGSSSEAGLFEGATYEAVELHVPSRRATVVSRVPAAYVDGPSNLSPDGQRALAFSLAPRRYLLLDPRSGEVVVDLMDHLGPPSRNRFLFGRFLHDGRLVVVSSSSEENLEQRVSTDIWILDATTAEILERVPLDGSLGHLRPFGEIEPGRLLLEAQARIDGAPFEPSPVELAGVEPLGDRSTAWLDVNTGRVHPLANGLVPLALLHEPPHPGSPPTHLFRSSGRSILRWQPNLEDPPASPAPEIVVAPQALPPDAPEILHNL